uniref:hypothetical protein n=1 Tax=Pseudonocardia sp. CA-138482 TaxID=3240023 RepID=UPI003F497ECD
MPPSPLSAQGLATPYELTATDRRQGPCNEANAAQSAFVEATIIDKATGQLSVYRPLVIDRGTRPAVAPVVPTLPAGAVVGIWFGYQGNVLTLAHAGGCVNGFFRSEFGQFAYCNAFAFFQAAHNAVRAGQLTVPPLGTAKDGQPCPTTRDFSVVDQDQSDNVITRYVAEPGGQIRQDTGAPLAPGEQFLTNGSDNGLLQNFIRPALGCPAFTAPDQTAGGAQAASLALDELQAEQQGAPVALVPPADPMVLLNDHRNLIKTNLYRLGTDQALTFKDNSADYCRQLQLVGAPRLQLDKQFTGGQPSPDIAVAPDLFTFLQQRFTATLQNLGCPKLNPQQKKRHS